MNGGQCRMARAALRLSMRELAASAHVGVITVVRFEAGERLQSRTIEDIQRALEGLGVAFNADGRSVRLRELPELNAI
jgi:transcriptional regulator with XRE-family HTH domain